MWLKTLIEGTAQFGKPLDCAIEWKEKVEAAGFVDVHQEIRKVGDLFYVCSVGCSC